MGSDVIVDPATNGSEAVLLSTFNNKHLSINSPQDHILILRVGTDNLKEERFTMETVHVLLNNSQSGSAELISLQKTINHVTYYVTAQDDTDTIQLQQFSSSPDPKHPDGRLFVLEPANTWCFLQSWKRKGFYIRSSQSTITLEKRARDDRKQFLFDLLPVSSDVQSS